MNDEVSPASSEPARRRPAPTSLSGHWLGGPAQVVTLRETTIIIAVKPDCYGCRDALNSGRRRIATLPVLFVGAGDVVDPEWVDGGASVFVSPDALRDLAITWPPFYVVVDPAFGEVVTEGVVFAIPQVEAEVTAFLSR